jgi:hypothetical protein
LHSAQPPTLCLSSPNEFKLRIARSALDHPRIALGLTSLLPDFTRIELRMRSAGSGPPTRREEAAEARRSRIAKLTEAMSSRSFHALLVQRFTAKLGAVVPADEPAPIPENMHRR